MHITRLLAVPAAAGVLMFAGASIANAGEINGHGGATQAPAHTNSICAFSGLEDGSESGGVFPGPGGAPPQNWGHSQRDARADGTTTMNDLKAMGVQPGDSCNGKSGFWAGGGGE